MDTETRSRAASRFLLIAAALLFSSGGAAIKATALPGWSVAGFRSAVAALALLALVPSSRSGWTWRVLPAGAAYASTLLLFVLSNKLTTAANAIFLQSTAPLYLLLIGPWLLREPVRRADLGFLSAVALGMSLFFLELEPASVTAPDPLRGNLLAALSGISWALTIAALRWLGRHTGGAGAMPAVIAGNAIAFLASLPFNVPMPAAGWADLAVVLYLGVFQVGLAYVCLTRAVRHVPAFEASTLLLVEPALNPVWAWLAHGERPGNWALIGGGMILAASLGNTWCRSRLPHAAAAAGSSRTG
jgi:drug/metabolite transporter (DMT)-like permease